MRVARVSFQFYPQKGGSITNLIELASKLSTKQVEQIIVVPERNNLSIPSMPSGIELHGVKSLAVDEERIPILLRIVFFALPVVKHLKVMTKKNKIDAIHINGFFLGTLLSLFLRMNGDRTHIIITQDGGLGDKMSVRHVFNEYFSYFLLLFSKAEVFLVDDGTYIDSCVNFMKKARLKYSIVRTAIDCQATKIRCKTLSGSETAKIISTHRLIKFKNVKDAIIAFDKVNKILMDASSELVIIGTGDQERDLKNLVESEGFKRIRFLGEVEHQKILELLPDYDIFIATSQISNVNLGVMEAMSAGLPIIAYDSGGTRRLVKNNKNGILVKTNDINGLAEAMVTLIKNPKMREEFGNAARETIVKERSWDVVVEAYYRSYCKCCDYGTQKG